MNNTSRVVSAIALFAASGLLVAHTLYNNPLGIQGKVSDLTYLWVHLQVHNWPYFLSLCFAICGFLALFLEREESTPLPINIGETPPSKERILEGMLEIQIDGQWKRIHKHQLNEWLTDQQLRDLDANELWKQQAMQCRPTPSEAANIHLQYYERRESICKTRPATKESSA